MKPSFATLSARRCLVDGAAGLSKQEQQAIAVLFRDEARKGAFSIPATDALRAFCEHVVAAFPYQHTTQVVYDYLPYLRRRARRASNTKRVPLAALILYATWLEHWANMVITVAMLRRGQSERVVAAYFAKQPPFEAKLDRLGVPLDLPDLGTRLRGDSLKLMCCRNDYVHYTWQGSHIGAAQRRHANMRNIVDQAPALLASLRGWEFRALDLANVRTIRRLLPKARLATPPVRVGMNRKRPAGAG